MTMSPSLFFEWPDEKLSCPVPRLPAGLCVGSLLHSVCLCGKVASCEDFGGATRLHGYRAALCPVRARLCAGAACLIRGSRGEAWDRMWLQRSAGANIVAHFHDPTVTEKRLVVPGVVFADQTVHAGNCLIALCCPHSRSLARTCARAHVSGGVVGPVCTHADTLLRAISLEHFHAATFFLDFLPQNTSISLSRGSVSGMRMHAHRQHVAPTGGTRQPESLRERTCAVRRDCFSAPHTHGSWLDPP